MNGLAGIAVINQDFSEAASLYKQALAFTEEHSEDFSLDPLLRIHIHHNLAEVLVMSSDLSEDLSFIGRQFPDDSAGKEIKKHNVQHSFKRHKVSTEGYLGSNLDYGELSGGLINNRECYLGRHNLSISPGERCLRTSCEDMKRKYLSVFSAKLSLAQQEFRKSYMQVCFY